MKRFSQQFHTEAKRLTLEAAEKRELRERLTAYMEYHPLPTELRASSRGQNPQSAHLAAEPFSLVSFPFALFFKSSAVAAALVLVVVPFMAEQAVPGDTLYGVKVQFNEEIRGSLTFGSYEKVEWETERLNRRIAEARVLANQGRLTEAVEAKVALAVRAHTASAKQEIEQMRTQDIDGAAIAQIALDTTLEVQSASLRNAQTESTMATDSVRPSLIASAIDESRGETVALTASSTLPSYAKLSARVEQNTTRIHELRDSITDLARETQLQEVNRRIEDVERIIKHAIDLSETEEREAQIRLIEALQRSQRLIVYMTEIQVIESIDIDTLVPVALTEAEQQQVRETLTREIATKVSRIETSLASLEGEAVLEKALRNLDEIAVMQADIASTTDFIVLQERAKEALQLTDDTLLMFAVEPPMPGDTSGSTTADTQNTPASSTDDGSESESVSTPANGVEGSGVDSSRPTSTPGQSTDTVDTDA